MLLRLGEHLCKQSVLSAAQLTRALSLQKKTGSRLGDILVSEGFTDYRALSKAVADLHSLPFVNLLENPPDADILFVGHAQDYLRLRAIPWKREDRRILIATSEPSEAIYLWGKKTFKESIRLVVTSPLDIRRTVEQAFGEVFERRSRLWLWSRKPYLSARTTLLRHQKIMLAAIGLGVGMLIGWSPLYAGMLFLIICHVLYAATMFFKMLIFAAGIPEPVNRSGEDVPAMDEKDLPVYTVLIPMYKEAASVPGMLESMQRMDYPASKLDIKLILEADDRETLEAACALKPNYHFDIIRVLPSSLRTKPKACNYALRFARGEFVTVFDADDRPDRLQLKKAVHAFRTLPDDVACLQARLNYYNANDNWITRFFSLEYTALFHFMLYGLERLGIPIPLGGTSNHIALKRIQELGEWDPYNVTEDADLGTRIAALGLKTRMIDSYTMEEAPNQVVPWIKQRSRWIKGYMQTWLVHMRNPYELWHALGPRGFIGFQFFIGLSCFSFLTAPIVWTASILWVGDMLAISDSVLPGWLAWFAAGNLTLNLATHWFLAFYCASHYRKHQSAMMLSALLYPLYLFLHSIASYKALWQLIFRPHFWEKTTHGLARQTDDLAFGREMVKPIDSRALSG